MQATRFISPSVGAAGLALAAFAVMAASSRGDDGFHETFGDDPIISGRWAMIPGENAARFSFDADTQSLTAAYNTGMPTARLVRPLGRTLHETDSVRCSVQFIVKNAGFSASSMFDAEISFGFLNTTVTGPDRAGYSSSAKAFDLLEFDYFPNVTFFGGPSLMTTIIHRNTGQGFYSSIDFVSGGETELNDPGEQDVPKDIALTAQIVYRGDTKTSTLRLYQGTAPLVINAGGGADHDMTTITTPLSSSGFDVNAFGLLLWKDTFSNSSTVVANLAFSDVEVLAPSFGDFDHDGDVDDADGEIFRNCAAGPGIAVDSNCLACDDDGDGDVDSDDFAAFQRSITGPR